MREGKAIVLIANHQLQGIFSNKSNLWRALQLLHLRVEDFVDIENYKMPHLREDKWIPVTYANIVNHLRELGKIILASPKDFVDAESSEDKVVRCSVSIDQRELNALLPELEELVPMDEATPVVDEPGKDIGSDNISETPLVSDVPPQDSIQNSSLQSQNSVQNFPPQNDETIPLAALPEKDNKEEPLIVFDGKTE